MRKNVRTFAHIQTIILCIKQVMMITNNNIGGYDGKGIYTSRHSHDFLAFRLDCLHNTESVCLQLVSDKDQG